MTSVCPVGWWYDFLLISFSFSERRRKLSFGSGAGIGTASDDSHGEMGKIKFGAFSRLSIQDDPSSPSAPKKATAAASESESDAADPLMELFRVEKETGDEGPGKDQPAAPRPDRPATERKFSAGAADSPSNSSLGSKEDLRPRTASASSRRSLGGLSAGEGAAVAMTPPKARLSPFLTTQMQRAKEEFEFLELKTPFSAGVASKGEAGNPSVASLSSAAAGDLGIFFKGPSVPASPAPPLGTISEQQASSGAATVPGNLAASGGFGATAAEAGEDGDSVVTATATAGALSASSSAAAAGEDAFHTSMVEEISGYESKQAEMDEMIKNLETSESESELW